MTIQINNKFKIDVKNIMFLKSIYLMFFLLTTSGFSESVLSGPNLKEIQNQESMRNNNPCFEFKSQIKYSLSPIEPANLYNPQGLVYWPLKRTGGRFISGKNVYVVSPSRQNNSYNISCEKEYEGKLGKTVTINKCNFLSESSDYESQVSWEIKKGKYREIEGEYLVSLQRNRDCGQSEWDSVRERIYPTKSLLKRKSYSSSDNGGYNQIIGF